MRDILKDWKGCIGFAVIGIVAGLITGMVLFMLVNGG
jgi:hypothetical protein